VAAFDILGEALWKATEKVFFESHCLMGFKQERKQCFALRGRVNFAQQLQKHGHLCAPAWCTYSTLTEDIDLNRIVKRALRHMLKALSDPELHGCLSFFCDVYLSKVSSGLDDTDEICWNKLNAAYRPLIEISFFILKHVWFADSTPNLLFSAYDVFHEYVQFAVQNDL